MASLAYQQWVAAGKPMSGLVRPAAALKAILRGYGYTVYDLGDESHLKADPPEDHTPFSATGWPAASPRWWVHAIDVMPPPAGSGLPSLAQLGARLVADRNAGVPGVLWIKYLNWEPGDGACWHESWQPSYARRASTDRGHLHISARTDVRDDHRADGYDLVARVRGDDVTKDEFVAWFQEALERVSVPGTDVGGFGRDRSGPEFFGDLERLREMLLGELPLPAGSPIGLVHFTDAQVDAVTDRLAAALSAQVELTDGDIDAIVGAVKRALREGTG